MDKSTLSNYGWVVIAVLVLSVMIALATPFGDYIGNAVKSTTEGLFDVQQNALGAAGLVIADQSFDDNGGSSIHVTPKWELTTLSAKTWSGLTNFDGNYVWTDGINIYYSYKSNQYVLNGDTWETKTWNGFSNIYGHSVWTDGTNIYYSSGSDQYVLNGDTWETKTWNGFSNIYGQAIWTDGTNIYYSSGSNQYVLNGDTWETKTWNGVSDIYGQAIWTDGTNCYYSYSYDSNGHNGYVFS